MISSKPRPILIEDLDAVVYAIADIRWESPVYQDTLLDETYIRSNLSRAFDTRAIIGSMSSKGIMITILSPSMFDPTVTAHEQLLWVHPAYRGSMAAVRLIRYTEEQLVLRGIKKLYVGSSTGINDEMTEQLYVRLGYKWCGRSLYKDF